MENSLSNVIPDMNLEERRLVVTRIILLCQEESCFRNYIAVSYTHLCVGCGAKKNTSGSVSMYDLRTAMEAADPDLPEMFNASSTEKDAEDKFSHISDMDYKKVDSYFVSYSSDGHKADEIVVIAVKDKADVDEAKESLTKHQQDRYNLLQSYEPKQVSRIQDGLVFTKEMCIRDRTETKPMQKHRLTEIQPVQKHRPMETRPDKIHQP